MFLELLFITLGSMAITIIVLIGLAYLIGQALSVITDSREEDNT